MSRRLLGLAVAVLTMWLGFGVQAVSASTVIPVQIYTYDGQPLPSPLPHAGIERCPPHGEGSRAVARVVDRGSEDSSPRYGSQGGVAYTYEGTPLLVRSAGNGGTEVGATGTARLHVLVLDPGSVAANGVEDVSQILLRSPGQLQSKFKHAKDFGVTGNYNPAKTATFSAAIHQHINSPGVRVIQGTYHKQPVTHYLDPANGLNVIAERGGTFISGWKLSPGQLSNVLSLGVCSGR